MNVLGLSCDYHDAAAAVIIDGSIAAAAEQERFSRVKHDRGLPIEATASCLAVAGITAAEVDAVVFHEKPLVVASRVLAARQRRGPRGIPRFVREAPVLLGRNLMIADRVERMLRDLGAADPPRLQYCEHHVSHAAAAFLPSPFESAAILTIDGIGEWTTASIGHGSHHRVDLLAEQRFPNSLGLLYSLATAWCGFEPNDGEYKLMGLAPYGTPRFRSGLADLVELADDGSFRIDPVTIRFWGADAHHLRALEAVFDGPPRPPGSPIGPRECDIARSVQDLTELAILRMAETARSWTGERSLCLAGGVALNCVANGALLRSGTFDDVWVQPAAGDAGSAVGAALWYWHDELGHPRPVHGVPRADSMNAAALGPSFGSEEIRRWLDEDGVAYRHVPASAELADLVAEELARGGVVGWFEGRMEFGPRALGHRSILADPRGPDVQRDVNERVKGRESFRPFAPAVLWEHAGEWYDIDAPSPYMLFTFDVAAEHRRPVAVEPADVAARARLPRSDVPACTHVDGSARVQTVHRETSPRFHELLSAFHRLTGCPVVLNTSFNVAGEPIVGLPEHALATARSAGLDLLVLEDCLITLRAGEVEE